MSKLYPQCNILIDTEPLFQDLVDKILDIHPSNPKNKGKGYTLTDSMEYHYEIPKRSEKMNQWFVRRGYKRGRDYIFCEEGYKVSNPSTVTAFLLEFAV
jgi:hypothetical protein